MKVMNFLSRNQVRPTRELPSAFTLIELLVVISIIVLLVGILLPALSSAKATVATTKCLSNSRTIAFVMQLYAHDDPRGYYPTARMPMSVPFEMSWIFLTQPYVNEVRAYQCPADESLNWDAPMMQRRSSYRINAYFTPNHHPYKGIRSDQIRSPSQTILAVELIENTAMDHFMPMYWGDPPDVANPMMQERQWDSLGQQPKTIVHTRHRGNANYVFADGHAATATFDITWQQVSGSRPFRNWYAPK